MECVKQIMIDMRKDSYKGLKELSYNRKRGEPVKQPEKTVYVGFNEKFQSYIFFTYKRIVVEHCVPKKSDKLCVLEESERLCLRRAHCRLFCTVALLN